MNDIVPKKNIVLYGTNAAGGVLGGIILMALRDMRFVPALIVGVIIALAGYGISRSGENRLTGKVFVAAGLLTAVSGIPIIGGIAGFIMTISGIGLIAVGVVNLVNFFKGLRSRRY